MSIEYASGFLSLNVLANMKVISWPSDRLSQVVCQTSQVADSIWYQVGKTDWKEVLILFFDSVTFSVSSTREFKPALRKAR